MREIEITKEASYSNGEKKSTRTKGRGTKKTDLPMLPAKMHDAERGYPISVSTELYKTVQEEHLRSVHLLNSSGQTLLAALETLVPPQGSGKVIGEYTGHVMRQLSKSICQVAQTKIAVVRSMHTVERDEKQ